MAANTPVYVRICHLNAQVPADSFLMLYISVAISLHFSFIRLMYRALCVSEVSL